MRITLVVVLAGVLMGSRSVPSIVPDASTGAVWSFLGALAQDPTDSLYRSARNALNNSDFRVAAALFKQIRDQHASSKYAADAFYWEAYARYKQGGKEELREARRLLSEQRSRYPKAATAGDATTLLNRINGQLAQRGDADAARDVTVAADDAGKGGNACSEDEDDTRIAALNALLQMDADRALPILKRVLARRERCSEILRRKAVFLVSQKRSNETEDILLTAARQDPDSEVREQAVFWLSQVGSERSVNALDSILRGSTDVELQKKALFALSQTKSDRAQATLREFASQENASSEVREQAVFWLGQSNSSDNVAFLKALFGKTANREIKDKIIFAISQNRGEGGAKWLLDIALNSKEEMDLRKQALFWAAQSGVPIADLSALYDKVSEPEMRDQLIFALSQRREPAAVDKLIQIARSDGNKENRKKAIFWLSQAKDPRAAEFLLQLIEQP